MTETTLDRVKSHLPIILTFATLLTWGVRLEGRVDSAIEHNKSTQSSIERIETKLGTIGEDVAFIKGYIEQ